MLVYFTRLVRQILLYSNTSYTDYLLLENVIKHKMKAKIKLMEYIRFIMKITINNDLNDGY